VLIGPVDCCGDRHAADPDRAVGGDQDVVRSQAKMVKAAHACGFQAFGRLTGDAAGLFRGQWPLEQDRGQRLRIVHCLFDDERVVVLGPDIEDAYQSGVLNSCGPPGGVQDAGAVGVFGVDDGERDGASECGVMSGPALEVKILRQAAAQGITTPEDRSWAYALHPCSCLCPHPARFIAIA